jgi:hypothetical protein
LANLEGRVKTEESNGSLLTQITKDNELMSVKTEYFDETMEKLSDGVFPNFGTGKPKNFKE